MSCYFSQKGTHKLILVVKRKDHSQFRSKGKDKNWPYRISQLHHFNIKDSGTCAREEEKTGHFTELLCSSPSQQDFMSHA